MQMQKHIITQLMSSDSVTLLNASYVIRQHNNVSDTTRYLTLALQHILLTSGHDIRIDDTQYLQTQHTALMKETQTAVQTLGTQIFFGRLVSSSFLDVEIIDYLCQVCKKCAFFCFSIEQFLYLTKISGQTNGNLEISVFFSQDFRLQT